MKETFHYPMTFVYLGCLSNKIGDDNFINTNVAEEMEMWITNQVTV